MTTRETILTPSQEMAAQARVVTVRWNAAQHEPVRLTETERAQLTATAGHRGVR